MMHTEEVKEIMKQLLELWKGSTDEERQAIRRLVHESKTAPVESCQETEKQ